MALIKCNECGKEISDTCDICIHCGFNIKEYKNSPNEKIELGKKKKSKKILLMISSLVLTFMIAIAIFFLTDYHAKPVIIEIPNLMDLEEDEAIEKLEESGFGYELIYEFDDLIEKGNVIEYTPTSTTEEDEIIFITISKGQSVIIPEISNTKEDTATSIITSNNLIPIIEYEYSDNVEEGYVIEYSPVGEVEKSTSVTITISKGPSFVISKNSTITWLNISNKADEWEFSNPYIEEGYLYIECSATYSKSFEWKDGGFGVAAINDTFDKKVPLEIIIDSSKVTAGEKTSFILKISIDDLDVQKPTTLSTLLSVLVDDEYDEIYANFAISW